MKAQKILSIDIDYCLNTNDFMHVFDLFCTNLYKLKEDRVLISNHHVDILDLINTITDPIDLYNIDFHHDIFYQDTCSPAELRNSVVDSSNWVGWLTIHRQVSKYTWIKQDMSEVFNKRTENAFNTLYDKGIQYDIVDSRNILFNSKRAVLEKKTDAYLKHKPVINIQNRIKKDLFNINFDYLFVCLSPDYTPKEHFFMYDLMESSKSAFFQKS